MRIRILLSLIHIYTEDCGRPVDFPDIDFAIPFTEQDCFHTFNGDWEQESGFRRQMATETEYIRCLLYTSQGPTCA